MNNSILGWTIKDWVIRPTMLFVINVIDFRPNRKEERRLGKLLFARPRKIELSKIYRSPDAGLTIKKLGESEVAGQLMEYRLTLKEGGMIYVLAEEHQVFLW
jgi:hypothetical protein